MFGSGSGRQGQHQRQADAAGEHAGDEAFSGNKIGGEGESDGGAAQPQRYGRHFAISRR